MITDKEIEVTTNEGIFTITITGQQLGETARRRMAALMPKARILDMKEKGGEQLDLTTRTKATK